MERPQKVNDRPMLQEGKAESKLKKTFGLEKEMVSLCWQNAATQILQTKEEQLRQEQVKKRPNSLVIWWLGLIF